MHKKLGCFFKRNHFNKINFLQKANTWNPNLRFQIVKVGGADVGGPVVAADGQQEGLVQLDDAVKPDGVWEVFDETL